MSVPENTSNRDPLLHLLGAMSASSDDYITGMEAAGQRQLVASEVIPTDIKGGTEEDLTALGFVLGDQIPGDGLFRHATLPTGWSKTGTSHDMWSRIVDEHGRERCAVFYKAAWYDRSAFLTVVSLDSYACSIAYGDAQLVLDDTWATREGMAAVFAECETREANDAAHWRASSSPHAAGYVAEHEQRQAKYSELRAEVGGDAASAEPLSGEVIPQ